MKKATYLLILLILVAAARNISAQGNKVSKITNPPLTAEFGFCAAGDAFCESGNRVRQDQANAPYVDGQDGVGVVFQLGSGSKDLTIDLVTSATRSVRLDFRDVIYYGNPQPAWWFSAPQQNVKPYINVLGAYHAKEQCGNAATCNENFVTRMNAGSFRVSGNNTDYKVQWNPTSVQTYINSPETTSAVNVNYIKDSSGEVFIITPLPNSSSNRVVAGMQGTLRKTDSPAGQYLMPFTLTVRYK